MTNKETPELLASAQTSFRLRAGKLYWCVSGHGIRIGAEAGGLDAKGYRVVRLNGTRLKSHRVVFALHHGRWPVGDLDHKNGERSDNRIRNLREADRSQNMWNRRAHVNSKSGILGVSAVGTKWLAQLRHKGVAVLRKTFDTLEAATAARRDAERKYFGDYAPKRKSK